MAKKILPQVWRSDEPLKIKMEATLHLTANIAYPLMIVFSVILLPAMIVRFYQGWFQMLYLDLPLFLASTCSVSSFYMVAQRELYPNEWRSRIKYIPFLMATGIGLAVTNSKAVIEAIIGKQTEFVRTPKYQLEANEEGWEGKKYVRRRAGWIPIIELGLAGYFLFTLVYSLTMENYLTTPFLLLFFSGLLLHGDDVAIPNPVAAAGERPARLVCARAPWSMPLNFLIYISCYLPCPQRACPALSPSLHTEHCHGLDLGGMLYAHIRRGH